LCTNNYFTKCCNKIYKILNQWNIPNHFSILNQSGFIAHPNSGLENVPKIGVWLMPDNQNQGMLKNFFLNYEYSCNHSCKITKTNNSKGK
jgi:hypothetical protein